MDVLKRIAKAANDGKMWKAYVAARTLAEIAARAVVEAGLPRPARCEDIPAVLSGSVLDARDAARLAEVLKVARSLHRTQDPEAAERAADDAVELLQKLAKAIRRRYPAIEMGENVRYVLKAAGVRAAYSLGRREVAVRAGRALGIDERLRLAVELSAELGIPPEEFVVSDISEHTTLERVIREGRLIYAEDLDEEIEWLAEKYIDYLCC